MTVKRPRLVVSTVGTSLLTNQLARDGSEEAWARALRAQANVAEVSALDREAQAALEALATRAAAVLQGPLAGQRRACAELNLLAALAGSGRLVAPQDHHWLVGTDTAAGRLVCQLLERHLTAHGAPTVLVVPTPGLNVGDTQAFWAGADQLLEFMHQHLQHYQKAYEVVFALVGGFKALQSLLGTAAPLWADGVAYLYEGMPEDAPPLWVPRLPLRLDWEALLPHAGTLALLAANAHLPGEAVAALPAALVQDWGEDQHLLSSWGKLVWLEMRERALSERLPDLPHIRYGPRFTGAWMSEARAAKRAAVAEWVSRVSAALVASQGDRRALRAHGGFQYEDYMDKGGLAHMRMADGDRVSCEPVEGGLLLRQYGHHDDVNDRP